MTKSEMVAVENTLRRSVQVLLTLRLQTVEQLAVGVGIPKSTLYRRLGARGLDQSFRAHEVQAIANYLGVPVADLYDGLNGLVKPDLVAVGAAVTHGYRPADEGPGAYGLAA